MVAKIRTELYCLLILLAAGFVFLQPGPVLLAVVLVAHLTIGLYLARPREPLLRAGRRLSAGTLFEGQTLEVRVDLENLGPDLEVVAMRDALPSGLLREEGETHAVARLPGGAKLSLCYAARVRRGRYRMPAVHVVVRDLLGYWTWQGEVACPATLTVLPRSQPLPGMAIGPRRTLAVPGAARSRRGGSGTEWFGTRQYRPGDPIRRVHWKAVARWDKLAVVEFEEERAADVMVVLDVRRQAYPAADGEDLLDAAARVTAALCDALLLQGHRVGLLFYGAYLDWVFPGYGRRHALRLKRELARARLGTSVVFERLSGLPVRLLRPGSQVMLVSPLVAGDEEDLGRLAACGYQIMVLVPETASSPPGMDRPELALASRLLALERKAMVRRLRLAHVRPVVLDTSLPLAPQLRAAWRRLRWR
jgi:uncharacterized protein (DUF58 family)